jgi:sugar phosphate isomerase/epimerase
MHCLPFYKTFLHRIFLLVIFLLLLSSANAQPQIGLQLYTFRAQLPKDVPGMLQKISSMGIRYLEGGGTYNLSREEYRSLLQKNNLQIVSLGAGFKELEDDPEAVAEKALFFGVKYVMCSWVPHNGEVFTIEDTRKAVDVFNKAGKLLKEKGLQFVYHAHGYVLGTGDVNIAAVMKAAKKAGIKYAFIEDESSRSLEQVPQSLAFLKKLK